MNDKRQQEIGAAYIPAHIMCDQSLTLTQKVLWGRIQGLSTKAGYCYASNGWISDQLGLKRGTVSNLISQLVEGGYLMRKVMRNESGEITERWLYPLTKVLEGVSTQELIGVSTQELPGINAEVERGINAEVEGSVRGSSVREESKEPPSVKPKMPQKDLTALTEHYAKIRGATPRGKAWLPIQQGFKQMVAVDGYSVEQVKGCMDRLVSWKVSWTINTVRRWIAEYTAGVMGKGKNDGRGETHVRDMSEYENAFDKKSGTPQPVG